MPIFSQQLAGPDGPTDWYYRTLVPKHPWENIEWRKWCLERAYESDEYARELWIICSRDLLFYVNTFGWLLEPREKSRWQLSRAFGSAREIPFITRRYQDEYMLSAQESIGNEDILSVKSREMGATWMFVYEFDHSWRFHGQMHYGLVSKDEESVDDPENPDSLMAKFDFIEEHLPAFLQVRRKRNTTKHTIKNMENGSTISGEACTANMFRGGRKRAVLGDEVHAWPADCDSDAQDSLQHVTPCRIMVSTPSRKRGQTGAFHDIATDFTKSMKRLELDWKMDDNKAGGLYTSKGSDVVILDHTYKFPTDYKFILDGKIRSPYFDYEWSRPGASPQSIASELEKDFGGATNRYIDQATIALARGMVRPPNIRARLQNPYGGEWLPVLELDPNGEIELWTHVDVGIRANADGTVFIPADLEFALGIDVSLGLAGAYSSYSAIVILHKKTGEQVGQWRGNRITPQDLAPFAVALGMAFNTGIMCPEVTGPGGIFASKVIELCYPNLWFRPSAKDAIGATTTKKVGYDNKDGGLQLLAVLEDGIKTGQVRLRSTIIVTELERYFIDQNGKLKHPLVGRGRQNAPEQSHGDCAIAAGASWFAIHNDSEPPDEETPDEPDEFTFAGRRRAHFRDDLRRGTTSYWNPNFGVTPGNFFGR